MTDKIVLRPENKPAPAKHFEDVWEDAEKLFDANKLNVDSILNELQAKISLYRLLGAGSFDPAELASAQASMIGKMLMTLTSLSLKENVNAYTALQQAIEERRLMKMEAGISSSGGMDKIIASLSTNKPEPMIGAHADMMKQIEDVLKKLTEAAASAD